MEKDPEQTIKNVVKNVKSEGLFDQFRKECIEEFENMETYQTLKKKVERHVSKFLSKHTFQGGLQKNQLRANLRQHINKSEFLLNSIQDLVDEVLSVKGHSFCLKIDKEVDRYLNSFQETESDQQNNEPLESLVIDDTNQSSIPETLFETKLIDSKQTPNIQANENIEIEQIELNLNVKSDELFHTASSSKNDETNVITSSNENKNDENSTNNDLFVLSPTFDSVTKPEKTECFGKSENTVTEEDTFSNISTEDINDEHTVVTTSQAQPDTIISEANSKDKSVKEESCIENITDEEDISDDNKTETHTLITEPISEDSESQESSDESDTLEYKSKLNFGPRRKSDRVRKVPAKFRDSLTKLNNEKSDSDSVSGNEVDKYEKKKHRNEKQRRGREMLESSTQKKSHNRLHHLKRRSRSISSENSSPRSPKYKRKERRHEHKVSHRNLSPYTENRDSHDSPSESSSGKRMRRKRQVYSPS